MVPETVARPRAGEVTETNGAELFDLGYELYRHDTNPHKAVPAPKTSTTIRTAPGWAVDVPTRSVRKLIEALV